MGALKIVGMFILSVALLGAALFVVLKLREGGEGPGEEGQGVVGENASLPTWSSGNQWSYENQTGAAYSYTVTLEENYEGVPCYRLTGNINPPFGGWGPHIRRMYGKATLGLFEEVINDDDQSQTTRYTRSYSADPWPLEVGKSYTESVIENRSYVQGWDYQSYPPTSQTLYVTVENIENIAVSAGTFESFRLVARDVSGLSIEERWYSVTAKNFAKIVNHQTGETLELSSYQV